VFLLSFSAKRGRRRRRRRGGYTMRFSVLPSVLYYLVDVTWWVPGFID